MTEAEKTEVVRGGRATLRQLTQGLLDGSESLRKACHNYLAHTGTSLAELPVDSNSNSNHSTPAPDSVSDSLPITNETASTPIQRSGLPENFTARRHYTGRTVLIPENIYQLPDGRELVPVEPTGPLGRNHRYALLTTEQFRQQLKGSMYVCCDGRIFDYSFTSTNPTLDPFDTGLTMADLERTGKYITPRLTSRVRRMAVRRRGRHRKPDPLHSKSAKA
jgi:hypothetical protein